MDEGGRDEHSACVWYPAQSVRRGASGGPRRSSLRSTLEQSYNGDVQFQSPRNSQFVCECQYAVEFGVPTSTGASMASTWRAASQSDFEHYTLKGDLIAYVNMRGLSQPSWGCKRFFIADQNHYSKKKRTKSSLPVCFRPRIFLAA